MANLPQGKATDQAAAALGISGRIVQDNAELQELAGDIKKRGLEDQIIIYEGKILDGRNRYQACIIAEVVPTYSQYEGDDALAFVLSKNLHRRQLTTSQKAMVAQSVKPLYEARARERQELSQAKPGVKIGNVVANLPPPCKSRDQAAAALGISGRR
jgi:hypothetical protein